MSLSVLVAPSGFKESLGAVEVAAAIAAGVRRVLPDATVRELPLVDGGEGFARGIATAAGGTVHEVTVTGPVGLPVGSHFALIDHGRTGVIEMAAAAGLSLVPRDLRDPTATTSHGVGELIIAALDAGARRLLIGCGDSGTSDGGAGMAQALGARLLSAHGADLAPGGGALTGLGRIDLTGLDPRLAGTPIEVACNPFNVLCGPRGVARVFGPQKGATPDQVERLADGLDRWAQVLGRDVGAPDGIELAASPGTGASGGLGAGLAAITGARLAPRYEVVMRYLDLDGALTGADLVITAEGGIDAQTPRGKVPAEVAARAKRQGLPVVVIAGTIGAGAASNLACGIDAYTSILPGPHTLTEAVTHCADWLTDEAERVLRLIMIGRGLAVHPGGPAPRRQVRIPATRLRVAA